MKRIVIAAIITIFLLSACTNENSSIDEPVPTPTVEMQQNKTIAQDQTVNEEVLTTAEEAMMFLQKAAEVTSNLKTVTFNSMVYKTTYLNNLDEPGNSHFFEYNSNYEGIMQRYPKLAYIIESTDNSSGILDNAGNYLYDENSRLSYTSKEFFDPELGQFSVSSYYSYGGVASDEQSYIGHSDLDYSFKTLEHIDDFIQLFMLYPDQLHIHNKIYEDIEGDNWTIELYLTNGQYMEHLVMLENNFFIGSYIDVEPESLYFVKSDKLRDLNLTLTFDSSYNLVQLTVFHTYNGLEEYVDLNRNDYMTTRYFVFFSDYNLPYTHTIPEEVILNADYN